MFRVGTAAEVPALPGVPPMGLTGRGLGGLVDPVGNPSWPDPTQGALTALALFHASGRPPGTGMSYKTERAPA